MRSFVRKVRNLAPLIQPNQIGCIVGQSDTPNYVDITQLPNASKDFRAQSVTIDATKLNLFLNPSLTFSWGVTNPFEFPIQGGNFRSYFLPATEEQTFKITGWLPDAASTVGVTFNNFPQVPEDFTQGVFSPINPTLYTSDALGLNCECNFVRVAASNGNTGTNFLSILNIGNLVHLILLPPNSVYNETIYISDARGLLVSSLTATQWAMTAAGATAQAFVMLGNVGTPIF
jgi:hypothetical protein